MRAAQSCPRDWRGAITSEAVCAALLFLLILAHCAKDPDVQGGSRVKWEELEVQVGRTRIQCYPLYQLWETGAPHLTCLNLSFPNCKMGITTPIMLAAVRKTDNNVKYQAQCLAHSCKCSVNTD